MDKLKLRQICFLFAAVLPVTKLIIYPSTLSYYAKNDLLLSAAVSFLAEGVVVAAVMLLARRTRCTLYDLLQNTFGQVTAKVVYLLLAAFLFFSALLPALEQKNFVTQILYENVPSYLSFTPFFAVCCFACVKGFKTVGRMADVAMPIFAIAFAVLILLAVPHADFGALQPAGAAGARGIFSGSLFGLPWFSECLYPLLFLGHFGYEKGGLWKVLLSFFIGAGAVLLLLAVFYGIFEDLSILTQYPLAHIAKYSTAGTTLGRVDFFFVFALTLVYIFCLCLPLQLCVHCIRKAFPRLAPLLPALAVNAALLALTVLFNYSFNAVQTFYMRYAFPVFLLFSYALPLCSQLLRKTPRGEGGREPDGQTARHERRRTRPPRAKERARRRQQKEHTPPQAKERVRIPRARRKEGA